MKSEIATNSSVELLSTTNSDSESTFVAMAIDKIAKSVVRDRSAPSEIVYSLSRQHSGVQEQQAETHH